MCVFVRNMEQTFAFIASCDNKYSINVKFTLEQAMKAQRGVEVQLYSYFTLDARWRKVVNATRRLLYWGKSASTHCTGRAQLKFLLALLKMYSNMFRPGVAIMW
jgi:hypothetical protein